MSTLYDRDGNQVGSEGGAQLRLTPTQRLHEVTMAALTRAPAAPEHSCEITRNARGVVQFTVTVRGTDLDAVITSAEQTFGQLAGRFPYPDTNGGD